MRTALGLLLVILCPADTAFSQAKDPTKPLAIQVAELRERIEKLEKENTALRAELETIKAAIAAAHPQDQNAAVAAAMKAGKIAVGMTVEQVETVTRGGVDGKGVLLSKNEAGEELYRWHMSNSINVIDNRNLGSTGGYYVVAKFKGGKMASFSVHDLRDG